VESLPACASLELFEPLELPEEPPEPELAETLESMPDLVRSGLESSPPQAANAEIAEPMAIARTVRVRNENSFMDDSLSRRGRARGY
jgi:hypothetical protein